MSVFGYNRTAIAYSAALVCAAPLWAETPTYNRDVRPILAEHCFRCHGQDHGARKADLRLDTPEGAAAVFESGEVIARITTTDPDARMPPPNAGSALTDNEIQTLRDWIVAGAHYEAHWAYIKPERPEIPTTKNTKWPQNPIDAFVLSALEKKGWPPAPPADPYVLIRRLSYDLTGLPPKPIEADAFAHDNRSDRVTWAVDDLLASPRYGEHMARYWLDLARYADSNGYHIDAKRSMWPYRDWVIDAYNKNMPFDAFTIEQMAGDLLPDATLEQRIATGFHRNTMFNEEGGIDQEEFRTKAVVDRVGTTMTVWMGTTMACAECHDHKYDPFTQQEFYQLFAFFNTVPELGGGTNQSRAPLVTLPYPKETQAALDSARSTLDQLEAQKPPEERGGHISQAESPLDKRILALRNRIEDLEKTAATSLVMAEMDEPRETHVLTRGNFLAPGERVTPGVPAIWPALAADAGSPPNRMNLARWLVGRDNPLTARVVMNRLWAQFFGRGIVSTVDDFGTRGALPSHPELLDYLAVEFMDSGWDIKYMVRLIVSSATYQQSSAVGRDNYIRDPQNIYLARGPRFRFDAETIRDTALAASGLLNTAIGGPPVFPYQPSGLWSEKMLTGYEVGEWPIVYGEDLYRRGLYTFRRRSVPYPTFAAFDTPTFEMCTAARSRTNTPLQALTTLNDPQFVEAARVLAERVAAFDGTDRERVVYAFRLCLARVPSDRETDFLLALFEKETTAFENDDAAARTLVASGRAPVIATDTAERRAGWMMLANILLNLDETLTKE